MVAAELAPEADEREWLATLGPLYDVPDCIHGCSGSPSCSGERCTFTCHDAEQVFCRHCGEEIIPCGGSLIPSVCTGWVHAGYESQPIGRHYCGGRSVRPSAEPAPDYCPDTRE
jgi:hypothetical protein